MHCMKCGKEIPEGQVFCDECLEVMTKYPVKPDTPVQILKRPARPDKKHARQLSQKEIIQKQSRKIRVLIWIVVLHFVALCLVGGLFLEKLSQDDPASSSGSSHSPLGQNYAVTENP